MKFLLSFFILLDFCPAVLSAQSPTLNKGPRRAIKIPQSLLERRIKEPRRNNAFQTALGQLAALQNPENWKEISWQDFLKQNKHNQDVERVSSHLDLKCVGNLCQLCPAPFPQGTFITTGNDEVNYKDLLAGEHLIYIAEGMNHDTKSAPREVVKILKAVRQTNPTAKILFAAEFLNWEHNSLAAWKEIETYKHELQQVYEYYNFWTDTENRRFFPTEEEFQQFIQQRKEIGQTLNELTQYTKNHTSLLKKAGEKSDLYFSPEYAPVFNAADELNIDQLALDDEVVGGWGEDLAVKVGEFVVWSSPTDRIPQWESLAEQSPDKETDRVAALSQVTKVSPWGVRERNNDWARRIKILRPFYDIVIVYGGSGHFDNTKYLDVQTQVGENNFTQIILYPMEDLPPSTACTYEQRDETVERHGITQDKRLAREKQAYAPQLERLTGPLQLEWQDPAKPFWVLYKTNEKIMNQTLQTWTPKQLEAFLQESNAQDKLSPAAKQKIEIYLPAN